MHGLLSTTVLDAFGGTDYHPVLVMDRVRIEPRTLVIGRL